MMYARVFMGGQPNEILDKKENDADPDIEWNDAYILTLNRDSKSTIYSGLPNIWYHLGQQRMNRFTKIYL